MTQDFKRILLHNLTRDYRAKGLSFTTAVGVATDEIECDNGGYNWRAFFAATPSDERILAAMERECAA